MATTLAKKPKAGTRKHLDVPGGQILNLKGLDRIQGYGDDMSIPQMRGNIAIDQTGTSQLQAVSEQSGARIEVVDNRPLITGVANGDSQVFVQPIYLNGVLLNGLPSPTEEMGCVFNNQRYFFNVALCRGEKGIWAPLPGAPAEYQWHVVDANGRGQHPDIVKKVFDLLLKAAELYYRRFYRDFVLAELAWFNNAIMEYEEAAEKVRTKKATDEEKADFYRARFSGHMGTMKEAEAKVLEWLEQNPEPSRS